MQSDWYKINFDKTMYFVRPITPNFDFYCYVSCPIILWDKMQAMPFTKYI